MSPLTRIIPLLLGGFVLSATAGDGPVLSFDPSEIDFGRQPQRQELRRDVIVRNTSSERIMFLDVETECGCTRPTLDTAVLDPGAVTMLHVGFYTTTFSGDVRKEILFKTTRGDAVLPLRANVSPFPGWDVSPLPVVFPTSEPGKSARLDVILTRSAGNAVRLASARSSIGWLSADIAATGDNRTFRLCLAKQADGPVGTQHATVVLKSEASDAMALQIPVVVPVVSKYQLAPNPVVLPIVAEGTEARLVFAISGWDQEEPPRVEAAPFKVVYLGSADGTHRYQISYTPPSAGSHRYPFRVWRGSRLEIDTFAVYRANAAHQNSHRMNAISN